MTPDISLIAYAVVGVVSFLAGAMTRIGYYRIMGRRVALPFIEQSSRNFTVVAVIVGLLSVVTVFTVQSSAIRTEKCNTEFREALAYNVMIAGEDRDLAKKIDELDSEYQRVLADALNKVITSSPDKAIGPLITLASETDRINAEKAQVQSNKDAANATRKAYPEPSCK